MSELKNLAESIRGLAANGNRAQQLVAAMSSAFESQSQKLASLRSAQHLSGVRQAQDNLGIARLQASQAADYLAALQQGADAFADFLIGGKPMMASGAHWVEGSEKRTLKPNIRYRTGENRYLYETDEFGRIIRFEAESLRLKPERGRLPHNRNTPGKLPGDHAGHLAADLFGGSPELDNLVSQHGNLVNLQEYRQLEKIWEAALKKVPPSTVSVVVEPQYKGNDLRPFKFKVLYKIDNQQGMARAISNPLQLN